MTGEEVKDLTEKYVMKTYNRLPLVPVKGEGARLWDENGKEYLDFVGGIAVNSLGHSPARVVDAMYEQARSLMHVSNLYYIESQARLAQLLVENSCCDKAFFCNSGAEANEGAIKLARKYAKNKGNQDKYEIITALQSFHGRTLATITATGQPKFQKGFEPLPEGFNYVPFNDLDALKNAVGPHTCAIMLEPVQGEGGVNPAYTSYLEGVKSLCRENDLLLIFDEIQCGMGRTGALFAYESYGVEPDILTLAKALAGGFPIGAVLAKEKAAAFGPGDHAATFGGNPVACAAGVAAVESLLEENFLKKVNESAGYFKKKLNELAQKHDQVKEVRGLGFLLGMELNIEGKDIVKSCQDNGLLINCVNGNVLRFIPPLIVRQKEIDTAIDILDKVLAG